ncbi:MAG TPA: YetF domain-containing protein [Gaiellaceae bacterium]|nr:YetF domain-containing protein [Gaiellaceae bacterium]
MVAHQPARGAAGRRAAQRIRPASDALDRCRRRRARAVRAACAPKRVVLPGQVPRDGARGARERDPRARLRLARGHDPRHARPRSGGRVEPRRRDRVRARPRSRRRRASLLPAVPGEPHDRRASIAARGALRRKARRPPRNGRVLLRVSAHADRGPARARIARAVRPDLARHDRRPRAAGRDAERLLGYGDAPRRRDDRCPRRARLLRELQAPVAQAGGRGRADHRRPGRRADTDEPRSQSITLEELLAMARQQGLPSLDRVQWAVLATSGSVSFIERERPTHS